MGNLTSAAGEAPCSWLQMSADWEYSMVLFVFFTLSSVLRIRAVYVYVHTQQHCTSRRRFLYFYP